MRRKPGDGRKEENESREEVELRTEIDKKNGITASRRREVEEEVEEEEFEREDTQQKGVARSQSCRQATRLASWETSPWLG